MMAFQRAFLRPFLVRATDRSGLVLGALATAAETDPELAAHLLRALAVAEAADPPGEDSGVPTPRITK